MSSSTASPPRPGWAARIAGGEAGFGAQRIAAGDEGEVVGAAAQFVDEVGDQIVEPAGSGRPARTSASRGTGVAEAKMAASTRSIHSRQRAAGGRSTSSTSRGSSPSRRRRRAAALIGRTAGRWAGPKIRARRRDATRRSNSRRAARSVIGAWRAASAGETQSSASSRSTIFAAGLARSLGATAMQGFGAAGKIGGEVEGGGGGEGDRAAPRCSARRGRRALAAGRRRATADWDPGVSSRSAARAAASAAGERGRCRTPKGRGFRLRRRGRPGGRRRRQGAALAAAETGSPSPAQVPQAWREAVRVRRSQVEPRRRGGEPVGVEAGRPGGEVAPQPEQLRRGPSGVADGEAQVAERACVGVEAQDLGGGRGAHAAPGASAARRRRAGRGADARRGERGWRRRRTGDRPPLPFRSPAPRPEPPPAAERLAFPGLSASPVVRRACRRSGAGTASPRSASGSGDEGQVGANHLAMVNRRRRFVTCIAAMIRPACRGCGDVR